MSWDDRVDFSSLVGKTLARVENLDNEQIIFTEAGTEKQWVLYHSQDCCESVSVEDICGDLNDLVGSPILTAEESVSGTDPEGMPPREREEYVDESFTWTFYRIATAKGLVSIRWYGSSNGYYSESVDFEARR